MCVKNMAFVSNMSYFYNNILNFQRMWFCIQGWWKMVNVCAWYPMVFSLAKENYLSIYLVFWTLRKIWYKILSFGSSCLNELMFMIHIVQKKLTSYMFKDHQRSELDIWHVLRDDVYWIVTQIQAKKVFSRLREIIAYYGDEKQFIQNASWLCFCNF